MVIFSKKNKNKRKKIKTLIIAIKVTFGCYPCYEIPKKNLMI